MASNQYRFTEIAKKDLDSVLNYIFNDLCNPLAAQNFFEEVTKAIQRILVFPKSYPLVNNEFLSKKDIRKAVIDNYILYYSFDIELHLITILRIVYGSRNLERDLKYI